ncbi:MAG: mechanosensitive ion channel family protein [Rhodospirillales bacterium]|nr:mechanosensitive ion channel family protein [Alphaproteobacteria bacterium]MCB9977309.1 mechanosensitive ion channel family protein [Rhodospirillales bacterium]
MRLRILLFFAVFAASLFPNFRAVRAEVSNDPAELHKILDEKQKQFEEIEGLFNKEDVNTQVLLEKRKKIKELRAEVQTLADSIKPMRDRLLADLNDLGPVPQPVEGVPFVPEPENIQHRRTELSEQSSALDGLAIQADALVSKSLRMQERIASLRREKFLSRILERQAPPYSPELWAAAKENLEIQANSFWTFVDAVREQNPSYPVLIISIFAFIAVLVLARTYSLRSLRKKIEELESMEDDSRFSKASVSSLLSMVITLLGFSFIQQAFLAQGIIHENNLTFSNQLILLSCFLIFTFIVTARFAVAGVIRRRTQWVTCFIAFLYAFDQIALAFGGTMGAAVELTIIESYVVTSLFALMIFAGSIFAFRASEKGMKFFIPQWVFLLFMFAGVFLLFSNLFGYVSLTRTVFERFVMLLSFLVFLLMIRSVARSFLRQIDSVFHKPDPDSTKEDERLLLFWLSLTLDVIIFFLCLPLTAGLIGVEWQEVQDWALHAFWGFSIGNVNISLANIGFGFGVFLLLLFMTRMLQNVLKDKILPKTRLDSSIRQSLIQLLGYLGLIVGMMAGVSAVGFDLSNLALIAGALSVGIGFGLQSIVSNFVSGLILLFERPIKVGDWVIVNSGEGIVKKISVRATEIETFDRTSIIVPNSELISSAVKNWNYNDRIGRVIINIGVTYNSKPRRVREILLECAKEHPSVLSHPAPSVFFKDFGDSALIFELRVFIRNIRDIYDVSTDLRLMIWDKLHEENIEIPFPQRDLHIKSSDLEKVIEKISPKLAGGPDHG